MLFPALSHYTFRYVTTSMRLSYNMKSLENSCKIISLKNLNSAKEVNYPYIQDFQIQRK